MQNVNSEYWFCTEFKLVANRIGKKIKSASALYFRACLSFKEFYFDSGFVFKTDPKSRTDSFFRKTEDLHPMVRNLHRIYRRTLSVN